MAQSLTTHPVTKEMTQHSIKPEAVQDTATKFYPEPHGFGPNIHYLFFHIPFYAKAPIYVYVSPSGLFRFGFLTKQAVLRSKLCMIHNPFPCHPPTSDTYNARFGVLTAVPVDTDVFWVVTTY